MVETEEEENDKDKVDDDEDDEEEDQKQLKEDQEDEYMPYISWERVAAFLVCIIGNIEENTRLPYRDTVLSEYGIGITSCRLWQKPSLESTTD